MAFNPQLTQEVTPVQSFAARSSAGGFINAINSAMGEKKEKKFSEDDTFNLRWEEFTQTREGLSLMDAEGNPTPIRIGDAPMGAILEFERQYPSYSQTVRSTFKTQNESLDPTTRSVEEARIAAIAKNAVEKDMAWSSSLDFVTAVSNAENLFKDDPAKQQAYIEKARQEYDIAQRLIAQNAETLAGEKASVEASNIIWGNTSKSLQPRISFTNQALVSMLEQFQRSPDSSVNLLEVAPEVVRLMPELAGFEKINRDNFQYFAEQLKVSSINLFKRDLEGQGVYVTDPPKEWVSTNFAVMDNLIADAGTDLSNEALAKRYGSAQTLELQVLANEMGMGANLALANIIGGDAGKSLLTQLQRAVQEKTIGATVGKEATATSATHYEAARNASVKENETARNLWQAALTGNYAELKEETPSGLTGAGDAIFGFSANQLAKVENGGVSSLTPNVYNTLYVPHTRLINEKAESDPVFKDVIFRTLKLDIGRDVDTLRRLASENDISFTLGPNNNLIFGRTPTPVPFVGGPLGSGGAVTTPEAENQKQLDIFQSSNKDLIAQITGKTTALGAMGLFGTSVLTGLIDTAPSREKRSKGSTPQSNIGQTLGIDFATYETEAGLPLGFLERTAYIESRGDVNAVSSTGATGLFQFTKGTAKDMGLTDRNDPVASTEATVKLALRNQSGLERTLGRKPTGGELYLAHQQGLGGASALLRNPEDNVVEALLPVYKGNRDRAEQAVRVNGGKVTMTAGEFANIWISKHGDNGMSGGRPTSMAEATGQIQPKPADTTVSATPAPASVASPAPVREGSQPETEAAMPTPTEEPTQQARATSAAPAVSQEGQALLANMGGEVDKTYQTAEDFQAATAAGELEAGDIVNVNGELYFIRKDGSAQKVGS